MKKLIFSFLILLAGVGIASAQLSSTTYYGTASDIFMGSSVSGTYDVTTTFVSSGSYYEMTVMTMDVSNHTVSITSPPKFIESGGVYTLDPNQKGAGTVTVPYGGGSIYDFDVIDITLSFINGKLTYYFEAEVPALGDMLIYFTFIES